MSLFCRITPPSLALGVAVVFTALCMAANPSTQPSAAFKAEMTVAAGEQSMTVVLFILNGKALVFEGGADGPVSVIFDLVNNSWREAASGQTVMLADAEQWAESSRKRSLASLETVKDEGLREFVRAMLDPELQASEHDGQLVLRNDIVSFVITPERVSDVWFDHLVAYDRLNAYHKAMTERKLPPFTQLEVLDELARRRVWPSSMEMCVSTPNGKIELHTAIKLSELTETERAAGMKILAAPSAP